MLHVWKPFASICEEHAICYGSLDSPSWCFWMVPTWQPPTPEPED